VEPERLIATALPEELAALLRRAREVRRRDDAFEGTLGASRVLLACTGSGPRRAACGLDRLLAEWPVSLVIGAGVAGALTAGLAHGDVVVVAPCVRDDQGQAPGADEAWRCRAGRLGAREAVAVSVDRVATRPSERLTLARGVAPDALACVDMESVAWSRTARRRATPCLILRAISDVASEELPDYLSECLDGEGGVSRARVAARALARPRSLPALFRLRRRALEAAERLSSFVEALLREEV
jgi:nucleoside phosphorylase